MLILKAANLSHPALAHGFFGRIGGASDGVYASLNCGPGSRDDRAHIEENRRRALAALAEGTPAELVTLAQVHSPEVVTVTVPWSMSEAPKADAMVTDRPGIALGVLAADCTPVLLADPAARIIGAAHAGWGGAFGGVIAGVVAAMEQLGADRNAVRAAIGPCIGQESYEVGPEFEARFGAADPTTRRFFVPSPRPNHWRFDLEAYVASRLHDAGVMTVEPLSVDTYTHPEKFFSFRRTTHRNESDYGRQLSAIMLRTCFSPNL